MVLSTFIKIKYMEKLEKQYNHIQATLTDIQESLPAEHMKTFPQYNSFTSLILNNAD
jgi:hypothetical protein